LLTVRYAIQTQAAPVLAGVHAMHQPLLLELSPPDPNGLRLVIKTAPRVIALTPELAPRSAATVLTVSGSDFPVEPGTTVLCVFASATPFDASSTGSSDIYLAGGVGSINTSATVTSDTQLRCAAPVIAAWPAGNTVSQTLRIL